MVNRPQLSPLIIREDSGKPGAGNLHARFEEGGGGGSHRPSATRLANSVSLRIPAGGQIPRQPAGELASIGEPNFLKVGLKLLLRRDLHPHQLALFFAFCLSAFSRLPGALPGHRPGLHPFPKSNSQRGPARKAPYEIIRHVDLKLPSFDKKAENGSGLSAFSASMATGACSAGGHDPVSGGLLYRTIRAIAAWIARVFGTPQKRSPAASYHASKIDSVREDLGQWIKVARISPRIPGLVHGLKPRGFRGLCRRDRTATRRGRSPAPYHSRWGRMVKFLLNTDHLR
jgi:hypothetical protein